MRLPINLKMLKGDMLTQYKLGIHKTRTGGEREINFLRFFVFMIFICSIIFPGNIIAEKLLIRAKNEYTGWVLNERNFKTCDGKILKINKPTDVIVSTEKKCPEKEQATPEKEQATPEKEQATPEKE